MMVVDMETMKKPLEKNRNILGQKQRKVSKSSKQICSPAHGNGPPLFPTELEPPLDPVKSWVQNLQLPSSPSPQPPQPPLSPPPASPSYGHQQPASQPAALQPEKTKQGGQQGGGEGECVSMESMVSLTLPTLEAQYSRGLALLKAGKFKEAIKSLEAVKKGVQEQANYGEYVIYKRTKNKRTTLSALCMFLGLAWEGLCRPRKALECSSLSIHQDPGWPVPFTKRSEYFAQFEQLLLDSEGGGEAEARARADLIITGDRGGDQVTLNKTGQGKGRTFTDLQEGLNAAKEGEVVYVEPGFHYREEGFTVHSSITLVGSSTRGVHLVSRGAPTLQVCCTAGGGRIHLEHLQFRNKWAGAKEGETEGETMKSSAAHLYIISASTVTIRDCLFPGGEEGTGGILVAEEAFYQSLLDLECQNPELRGSSGGVEGGNLRLLIDFCIFSQIRLNAAVHSNNQAVAVLSNCEVRECGGAGVRAEEGSTLNLLNCQVRECGLECVTVDTVSTVNLRGCLLTRSGLAEGRGPRRYRAGLALAGSSKGTVSRSLLSRHPSAVSCDDSDLVLEETCVMDISPGEEGGEEGNLELRHSAVFVRQGGSVLVQRNNFHNCSLVFLLQHGAAPTIVDNNVESCLIGFICGARALPRIERNVFHCILMSIGMFVEDSRGSVTSNIFQYVANGLDVHRGSAPRMLDNTYTRLAVPGLTGGLSFDIQRLHSGRLEEMEAAEVISFSCDTEEAVAAATLSRRQATQERERPCPCCGEVRQREVACASCANIAYCSAACRDHDKPRHRTFCGISLKDMF